MPLQKSSLEDNLRSALAQENWDDAASEIAAAIDNYIRSATVTVPAAGLISPGGLSPAPVTGKATGSIS